MHDNQLIKVAEFVQNRDIQLVVSILRDKLPKEVIKHAHIVIELSQMINFLELKNDII